MGPVTAWVSPARPTGSRIWRVFDKELRSQGWKERSRFQKKEATAWMVWRCKSDAPIDITPFKDDLGVDRTRSKKVNTQWSRKHPAETDKLVLNRNNDFEFVGEITSSLRCPFVAHVRKTNPRDELGSSSYQDLLIIYSGRTSSDHATRGPIWTGVDRSWQQQRKHLESRCKVEDFFQLFIKPALPKDSSSFRIRAI